MALNLSRLKTRFRLLRVLGLCPLASRYRQLSQSYTLPLLRSQWARHLSRVLPARPSRLPPLPYLMRANMLRGKTRARVKPTALPAPRPTFPVPLHLLSFLPSPSTDSVPLKIVSLVQLGRTVSRLRPKILHRLPRSTDPNLRPQRPLLLLAALETILGGLRRPHPVLSYLTRIAAMSLPAPPALPQPITVLDPLGSASVTSRVCNLVATTTLPAVVAGVAHRLDAAHHRAHIPVLVPLPGRVLLAADRPGLLPLMLVE
jgi:hypothetical protein